MRIDDVKIFCMENLKIQRTTLGQATVVQLEGPLTLATLFDFQNTVREPGYGDTILDLTQVPYIDSAGLGAILAHWAHTQRNKDRFAVVGANDRVQVLLEITKVNALLPAFPTVKEAGRSFHIHAQDAIDGTA